MQFVVYTCSPSHIGLLLILRFARHSLIPRLPLILHRCFLSAPSTHLFIWLSVTHLAHIHLDIISSGISCLIISLSLVERLPKYCDLPYITFTKMTVFLVIFCTRYESIRARTVSVVDLCQSYVFFLFSRTLPQALSTFDSSN